MGNMLHIDQRKVYSENCRTGSAIAIGLILFNVN